ncbi:MAG: hypothetical protein AAB263_01095, partial [Planctomycetota bacterium]
EASGEHVDFGDGSHCTLASDGNRVVLAPNGYAVTTHTYAKPGNYVITARNRRADGQEAVRRSVVEVTAGA